MKHQLHPDKMAPQRLSAVLLWSVALTFLVAIVAISRLLIDHGRTEATEQGMARAAQAAASADSAINRTFVAVDMLLAGMPDLVREASSDTAEVPPSRAHKMLATIARQHLLVRDVALITVDGKTIAAAQNSSHEMGLKLPPPFFERLVTLPTPALVVSDPTQNFSTSETVFYFGRPAGEYRGQKLLVVAEVPIPIVSGVLAAGIPIDRMVFTLERDEGQLLASAPAIVIPLNRQVTQPWGPDDTKGAARLARGRTDGSPSIVAARNTLYGGLIVAVSIPLDAVLAPWQRDRAKIKVVALFMAALVLVSAALTHWQFARLARARSEVARGRDALDQALASMRDGLLICDRHDRVVAWNGRYLECFPWLAPLLKVDVPYATLVAESAAHVLPHASEAERHLWIANRIDAHRAKAGSFEQHIGEGLVIEVTETKTAGGGTVSVFRDVTRTDRELAIAKASSLAARTSYHHALVTLIDEVMQPINSMMGAVGLLGTMDIPAAQRRHVDSARRTGERLLSLLSKKLAGASQAFAADPPRRTHSMGITEAKRESEFDRG